jgi:hypothetical protein
MTLCSLVEGYQQWEHNTPSSAWMDGWMQHVPAECWYPPNHTTWCQNTDNNLNAVEIKLVKMI